MAGEEFDVRTATPGSARVAIRISSVRRVALDERENDCELKQSVEMRTCGVRVGWASRLPFDASCVGHRMSQDV